MKDMNKKQRYTYIALSVFLGLTYLYLSILVDRDIFRVFDYKSMIVLQNAFNRTIDVPFSIITLLGSSEVTFITLACIFMGFLFVKRHFFAGLVLYFAVFIIELTSKLLIYHPAPPAFLNRYVLDFHLPSSFVVHTNFSYPSGHMARISFLAVVLLFSLSLIKSSLLKKIITVMAIVAFTAVTFISRIYLGEHWLSDVMGGLILGSAIASLAITFW